jgi:hypothetical protein
MAVYNKIVPTSVMSTDALFREYGKFFSDSWESLGWAKQADTGQIDWSTVTRETTSSWTMKGYEIRKSGTGGGTAVYMKVQYGSGYNANCLGIQIHYGTGSDGAGTITGGITSTNLRMMGASGAVAGIGYFTVAGDDERFLISQGEATTPVNNSMAWFQRTCDVADGADNATGWVWGQIGYLASPLSASQYGEWSGGPGTQDAGISWMYWPRLSCASGAVPYFPVFVQALTNSGYFMLRDVLFCPYAFAPVNSIHVVNHYGANRTYKAVCGNANTSTWFGYTVPTTMSVLMRID